MKLLLWKGLQNLLDGKARIEYAPGYQLSKKGV